MIPQRHAFIPSLYAISGEQPVRYLPPWDVVASNIYEVPDAHVTVQAVSSEDLKTDPYLVPAEKYLHDWDKNFDYIVMIEMDHRSFKGPFQAPPQLQLVSDDGYARLYRIIK